MIFLAEINEVIALHRCNFGKAVNRQNKVCRYLAGKTETALTPTVIAVEISGMIAADLAEIVLAKAGYYFA
jgi:predicted metal-dependent peptidase